ncbi:hypothetical protein C2I27_04135 [Priestia megaterium]|uniref:hypothetical protein n=1 Tax=Priestia megaterium TaxID=1404 RepID=UPI000D5142DF|nr:hypothetical protein [Priestia megaterium]PVC75082.1 hypothetical protein C2I27_04135 [Priestia megaterium]
MPVPATTGQLRTKVYEMEIGDYIVATISGGGSAAPTFSPVNFGRWSDVTQITRNQEFPVNGIETASNSYFFFVKVAKGILVADRVCLNLINWDFLNLNKLIQGVPWNSLNVIPTMISNTSPSGVVSASGVYGVKEPYMAFNKTDGDPSLTWTAGSPTGWIAYEFPVETVISGYSIKVVLTGEAPKAWTYEAWDGVNWVELDRRSNITNWVSNTKKTFYTSNTKAYVKYRINISAGASPSYISVDELEMFETTGTIRSLTGGVAYADDNSKKSLTDKGYGAWPTNNEWDRYIMNFPQGKIQSGKTLDDVFHYNSVQTWCQDTTVQGFIQYNNNDKVTGSDKRSCRGLTNNPSQMEWHTSNLQQTYLGFRPVFEYEE